MTQAIKIIKGGMMENHQNPKRQNDGQNIPKS